MTETNIDVKLEAISKGVRLYQIPPQLGVSQATFDKLLRKPLTDEKREQILNAISQLATNR